MKTEDDKALGGHESHGGREDLGPAAPSTASHAVPLSEFGRDHWSTFAYLETRWVDAGGSIDREKMRCDIKRHPQYGHMVVMLNADKEYPTRLRDGVLLRDHDDWDCMYDLEAAGLLVVGGTGMYPVVSLTRIGQTVAGQLRAAIAAAREARTYSAYATFVPVIGSVSVVGSEASREK